MKPYIGVKIVAAAKIDKVEEVDGKTKLTFVGGKTMRLPKEFLDRHLPKRGGYLVKYPDGYLSFSPGKTFEDAYREVDNNEANIIVDDFIAQNDPGAEQ